jgi:hypothetical protein
LVLVPVATGVLGACGSDTEAARDLAPGATHGTASPDDGPTTRVLFVRGGPGTGGFLEGGADEQLSDIGDTSTRPGNHGWGELAALLRADGFEVVQHIEDPAVRDATTVLASEQLASFDVVVLGSNNGTYGDADAAALETYVRDGGGVLFVSDANWGRDWQDAPASDQSLLTPFDLEVNQDHGTYAVDRSELVVPDHPALAGVDAFDGEGVSPFTVVDLLPDVTPTVLARAEGDVRRPSTTTDPATPGPLSPAGPDDAALVVVTLGDGRVAGAFDRNTFFNRDGAGTSLHREDNRRLARSLFAWLAGRQPPA